MKKIKENYLGFFILVVVPIALGALCTWQLWEQDIFWQVRAGDEILFGAPGHRLQEVDTWSFTGRGRPWINFQWLATAMLRAMYALGTESGLVAWRAILAAIFFWLISKIGLASTKPKTTTSLLAVGFTAVAFYLAMAFKIEIRSDFFNFIIAAILVLVWSGEATVKRKLAAAMVGCVLSANIHTGTAPFVIVLATGYIFSEVGLSFQKRLFWSVLAVLTILVNPYGTGPLKIIYDILNYKQTNLFDNYDHYPLMFGKASLNQFGVAAWAWSVLAALGWFGLTKEMYRTWQKDIPAAAAKILVGVIFTAMSINRMRAFPYHLIYFLPYITQSLQLCAKMLPLSGFRIRGQAVCIGSLAVFGLLTWGMIVQEEVYPLQRGFGLAPGMWPIGNSKFIKETLPKGNMLNTWGFGGYFVWHLQEYPTFGDTRETMFFDFQSEMLLAQTSADSMRKLCQRYDINLAVIPTPLPRFDPNSGGFFDGIRFVFPEEEWAIVHFDNISTLVIKRIPENAAIIAKHEFKLLLPEMPGNYYFMSKMRNAETDALFSKEADRCIAREPKNTICRIGQSLAWRRIDQSQSRLGEARIMLEENIGYPSTQKLELLVELMAIDKALGDSPAAEKRSRQIDALMKGL